jgi:hypothetical protein
MQDYYILNELIHSDKNYNDTIDEILSCIDDDFKFRNEEITVGFDSSDVTMKLSNFVSNLIVWKPFNYYKRNLAECFIIDFTKFNSNILAKYFNKIIIEFSNEDSQEVNLIIGSIIETLSDLSGEFNVRVGNTLNLYDLIQLSKRNEDFDKLIRFTIPDGMQFDEIEDLLALKNRELIQILSTEDNVLRNYVNSKTGINIKQLGQTMINIGLKPDLDGNIIPEPINTNYIQGLRNEDDYYTNGTGARKALITNFEEVKNAG